MAFRNQFNIDGVAKITDGFGRFKVWCEGVEARIRDELDDLAFRFYLSTFTGIIDYSNQLRRGLEDSVVFFRKFSAYFEPRHKAVMMKIEMLIREDVAGLTEYINSIIQTGSRLSPAAEEVLTTYIELNGFQPLKEFCAKGNSSQSSSSASGSQDNSAAQAQAMSFRNREPFVDFADDLSKLTEAQLVDKPISVGTSRAGKAFDSFLPCSFTPSDSDLIAQYQREMRNAQRTDVRANVVYYGVRRKAISAPMLGRSLYSSTSPFGFACDGLYYLYNRDSTEHSSERFRPEVISPASGLTPIHTSAFCQTMGILMLSSYRSVSLYKSNTLQPTFLIYHNILSYTPNLLCAALDEWSLSLMVGISNSAYLLQPMQYQRVSIDDSSSGAYTMSSADPFRKSQAPQGKQIPGAGIGTGVGVGIGVGAGVGSSTGVSTSVGVNAGVNSVSSVGAAGVGMGMSMGMGMGMGTSLSVGVGMGINQGANGSIGASANSSGEMMSSAATGGVNPAGYNQSNTPPNTGKASVSDSKDYLATQQFIDKGGRSVLRCAFGWNGNLLALGMSDRPLCGGQGSGPGVNRNMATLTTRSTDPWALGNVCIYDIRTGHVARSMQHNGGKISALTFSGKYVCAGGCFGDVRIWDTETGTSVLETNISGSGRSVSPVVSIDVAPSEEYVVACTGKQLHYSQLYTRGVRPSVPNNLTIPATTLGDAGLFKAAKFTVSGTVHTVCSL